QNGMTLTFGNGLLIHGGYGAISNNSNFWNTTLVNHARLRMDSGSFMGIGSSDFEFWGTRFFNETDGVLEVSAGNVNNRFVISGNWTNRGTVTLNSGTLELAGVFYPEDVGGIDRDGGVAGGLPTAGLVRLTGILNNRSRATGDPATLTLDGGAGGLGTWYVGGGDNTTDKIRGGVVDTSNGATLNLEGG